ncbi:hypothetical protein L7F22_036181 [Adiantum nelumboides]|nr:hypothetical protein [Adiantum nelumboides]
MLARMAVAMGGRVAEELIFGDNEVSSGASSDFEGATKIARDMVTKYGMRKAVGLVASATTNMSMETQLLVETEVKELLQRAYESAKNILTVHQDELHMLVKALLERETMAASEIKELLAQGKSSSSVTEQARPTHVPQPTLSFPSAAAAASAAAGAAAAATSAVSTAAKGNGASQQPVGS